ncbi:hypothetical protein ABW19_dt0207140 [Dactylella cylindrospora]|nr:hypothetical protein ABW19_dt0207140 [Dactylella cylindrospora]
MEHQKVLGGEPPVTPIHPTTLETRERKGLKEEVTVYQLSTFMLQPSLSFRFFLLNPIPPAGQRTGIFCCFHLVSPPRPIKLVKLNLIGVSWVRIRVRERYGQG